MGGGVIDDSCLPSPTYQEDATFRPQLSTPFGDNSSEAVWLLPNQPQTQEAGDGSK